MEIDDIVKKLIDKPYMMQMGARKIASRIGASPEDVKLAKNVVYRNKLLREVPDGNLSPHKVPNILLLDIETAPIKAYVWDCWRQYIHLDQIIAPWYMITWAAKWLLEPEVLSQRLSKNEVILEDDKRIVETLWHLLNKADIVIAHNGERFDVPRIKTRFLIHGLPPTTYYQQVDTWKVASREFAFPSNKLDALARTMGIEEKLPTEFKLWVKCLEGDEESLRYMEQYNRHDITILEEVYLWLRPYIKSHPNYNLYIDSDKPVCPHCGREHLEFVGYYYFTQTGKYRNYRCLDCGALSRERKSVYGNSKSILVSNGK